MYISKVSIRNFRSLNEINVELGKDNILLGPNNVGKTSFLEAINYAIGWGSTATPQEDDFYVENFENFDPKDAAPIEVTLEFREDPEERFSEDIVQQFGEGIIQFDEKTSGQLEEPIRFFTMRYDYKFSQEKNRYIESRVFLDRNDKPLVSRNTGVRREHLSYFPFFYLQTLRDIRRDMNSRTSYWGRIKRSVDYTPKEKQIQEIIEQLDGLLIDNEERMTQLISRLKEIEQTINLSTDEKSLFLQSLSKRNWELLQNLSIQIKTANSNVPLPIEKHGMGTQNITSLVIFNAYLELLLPELIENEETTPIIGIEEPEAHIYPHSQRALFEQLTRIPGQKIISTHSPYIVDQANIHDYILFTNISGKTKVRRIPRYKQDFDFVYGLPPIAYQNHAFLSDDELHVLRRFIQYRNSELLFSSVFLMCEGDSERIFFEMVAPKFLGKSLGRYGVSIVPCEGRAYSHFLKIASSYALNIPWVIFSDGEADTQEIVRQAVFSNGYSEEELLDRVIFLPDGQDFESYYIRWLGTETLEQIIADKYGHKTLSIFQKELSKKLKEGTPVPTGEGLINAFIDSRKNGKTIFAQYIAEHVLNNGLELPEKIVDTLKKIQP